MSRNMVITYSILSIVQYII